MSATRRAIPAEARPDESTTGLREAPAAALVAAANPQIPRTAARMAAAQLVVTELPRTPALRLVPLLRSSRPRQFVHVPTHAVGVHPEQRQYPRAKLKLPLRLRAVGGEPEPYPITVVMRDISSTGVYFLCPKQLAAGTQVELEVVLVSKPMGRGSVVMTTMAHVCRSEAAAMPGWYGLAALFDDVQFDHDDDLPSRFRRP
ncbi:MAG: PilZ domain-containing protein [Acidobacteria bacterium Pan2503]|uniref:PilZ domain-containing protein n=1 Tax=Candidatus Acidiferrum panamense TaxID=2741543 RepID=A0A7V8NWJ4_9BACT|nr:PilZ domain-containing protein [Candidatus Acidoferrum panamensis]